MSGSSWPESFPINRARWIFLAAWLPIALITRVAATDDHEFARLGTIESLVERHNYYLEESKFHGTGDRIFYNGHFYSHQPPLLATLQSPVFWVLSKFGLHFWNTAPFDLAYYLFTALTNGVTLALTIVVFDVIFRSGGVTPGWSLVCAFVLPLGSWMLPYGLVTNNHEVAGFLVTLLALLLLELDAGRVTTARLSLLGVTLGLLVTVEVLPVVSFVPLTLVYLLAKPAMRSRQRIMPWAAGLAVPLLLHALINIPQTGNLIPGGFHSELFNYEGSRFTSATLSGNMNHASLSDLIDYAWKAMFAEKGYFSYAPTLLLGVIAGVLGWRYWARTRGVHIVLLGGTILSLGASLAMTNNFGGFAAGFRHATYLAPAMLILLLPIFASTTAAARWASRAILGVSAASAAALFLIMTPRPFFPYRFPPEGPIVSSWDRYVPVLAHVVDRASGKVDGFGKPIPAVK